MVWDMLGVLIGFATVMLLLSVIVTALVQVCQHLAGMRARNLRFGLTAVVQEFLPDDKEVKTPEAAKKRDSLSEGFARAIVANASPLQPGAFKTAVFGGTCTWLTPKRLKECAAATLWEGIDSKTVERLKKRFEEIEPDLQKRFLGKIRILTLGLAVLVAALFQVNSFALLKTLSANAEYAKLVEALATKATEAHEEVQKLRTHDEIMLEGLEKLAAQHKDAEDRKAKAIDEDMKVTEESLQEALKDLGSDRQAILLEEFTTIVGQLHIVYAEKSATLARQAKDYLSTLDIVPVVSWNKFKDFFWDSEQSLENWLGVLFTAILLTFGAPFWFRMLQTAAGLRDLLKPADDKKKKKDEGEGEGN